MTIEHDLEVLALPRCVSAQRTKQPREDRTHMPTTVIIPERLGTPKTFQQRIRRQNHLPDPLNPLSSLPTTNGSDILHDPLSSLRLAGSGFPRNNDALVLLVGVHVVVGRLRYREYVRRHFESVLVAVRGEDFWGVDAEVCRGGTVSVPDGMSAESSPLNGLTEIKTWAMYVYGV